MDWTEWIALGIVSAAVILFIRHLTRRGGCGRCSSVTCPLKKHFPSPKKTS